VSGRTAKALVVVLPVIASLLPVVACGKESNAVGPGGECFLATDCEPGLVCVPQRDGTRLCSNDLTRVAGDVPPEAGADAREGGDAPADGPVQVPDTGTDTSVPPQDAADEG
jgi:hypothetical protein